VVVGIQQRSDRHHDLQLGVHISCGGLSGEPLHQRVGHDLIAAARITGRLHRVGVVAQRLQTRHTLLGSQISRQHTHRVRRRPQRDPTVLRFGSSALQIGLRIGLVGMFAGTRRRAPRTQLRNPSSSDLGVHLTPSGGVQMPSLGHHH
jgi:hypothetical protein